MKIYFCRCLLVLIIALFVSVIPVFAQSPTTETDESESSFAEFIDGIGVSLVEPFNSAEKFGHIGGKVQSLTVWRHRDSYDASGAIIKSTANSSSLGFFLDYKSPVLKGFSSGLQYVHVIKTHDGHHATLYNDAYYNSNEKYHLLNEFYLGYNFGSFGLDKTDLKFGRQIINLDFFKKVALRHKEQSMYGPVLTIKDIPELSLTLGHMRKFSSWSSQDTPTAPTKFTNLGYVLQVPYRTSGATFISGTCTGIPKTSITAYDWYLYNLLNVYGNKISYSIDLNDDVELIPRVHFAWQREVGRMKKDGRGKIKSYAFEVATTCKYKGFSIEPGYTLISDNEENQINDFLNPFDTSFVVDAEKGGLYTRPLNAGSQSFTLCSIFELQKTKIISTYYYTLHPKDSVNSATDRGTRDQQIEADIIQQLTKNLSTKVSLIYGRQGTNITTRKDLETREMRFFLTYKF